MKLLALADAGPFFDDVVARGVPTECLHLQRHTNPRALRLALSVGAAFEPDAVVTRGVSGQLVGEAIARRGGRRPRDERAHAAHAGRPARAAAAAPARAHPAGGPENRWRDCGHPAAGAAARAPRLPARAHRSRAKWGVRARRAGRRGVAGARERVLGAVRVRTAAREARGSVHRGRGRCATRKPGDPRLRGRRGLGARAARAARGRQRSDAARGTARRARADPRRRRPLPSQRGGGASDEHPGGDGPRAAGGGHGRGRDGRAGGGRRDRPPGARRRPRAGPARAARARCAIPSAPARWARPGGGASASASAAS